MEIELLIKRAILIERNRIWDAIFDFRDKNDNLDSIKIELDEANFLVFRYDTYNDKIKLLKSVINSSFICKTESALVNIGYDPYFIRNINTPPIIYFKDLYIYNLLNKFNELPENEQIDCLKNKEVDKLLTNFINPI